MLAKVKALLSKAKVSFAVGSNSASSSTQAPPPAPASASASAASSKVAVTDSIERCPTHSGPVTEEGYCHASCMKHPLPSVAVPQRFRMRPIASQLQRDALTFTCSSPSTTAGTSHSNTAHHAAESPRGQHMLPTRSQLASALHVPPRASVSTHRPMPSSSAAPASAPARATQQQQQQQQHAGVAEAAPQQETAAMALMRDVMAGSAAGVAITVVGHPLDTVKTRLQAQSSTHRLYTGTLDCIRQTFRTEGVKGFYKVRFAAFHRNGCLLAVRLRNREHKPLLAGSVPAAAAACAAPAACAA